MNCRIKWNLEETIMLVNLYYKYHDKSQDILNKQISDLSQILINRATYLHIAVPDDYRNTAGIKLQYQILKCYIENSSSSFNHPTESMIKANDLYLSFRDIFNESVDNFYIKYSL